MTSPPRSVRRLLRRLVESLPSRLRSSPSLGRSCCCFTRDLGRQNDSANSIARSAPGCNPSDGGCVGMSE
jgi:hypothetical protein